MIRADLENWAEKRGQPTFPAEATVMLGSAGPLRPWVGNLPLGASREGPGETRQHGAGMGWWAE